MGTILKHVQLRKLFMRVFLVKMFLCSFSLSLALANDLSGQGILDKKISLRVTNKSFENTLKLIEDRAGVKFLYLSGLIDSNQNVNLEVSDKSVNSLLEELCAPRGLEYELDGNYIILTKKAAEEDSSSKEAQQIRHIDERKKITGKVIDENGEGVPGATILVKGTDRGTTTNLEGEFELAVESTEILAISFIGYKKQEILVSDQSNIDIQLETDVVALDELVVIGYGTMRKSDIIGSVATVKAEDLSLKSVSNFDAALQGMAAGVSVLSQSGKPGAPSTIKIRGANSIALGTEPLWVIDGMPIQLNPGGIGSSNQNPMSLINPNDIESIQVLKDAAALAIYGSRGSNGVIIVTTKQGESGKAYTSISLTSGLSDFSRTPSDVGYVSSDEWLDIMDQATLNSTRGNRTYNIKDTYRGLPDADPDQEIGRDVIDVLNINTDWFDEAFRAASFQELNVSSARGTEKARFYFSGNYRSDKGVVNHNQLDRVSFRSNLSFEPINNVTLDVKLTFSYTDNERRNDDLTTITKFSLPWMPVFDPNNKNAYWNPYLASNLVSRNDPNNLKNNVQQLRTLGNLGLKYNVPGIDGLSLKTEISTDIINSSIVIWRGRNINLIGNDPANAGNEESATYKSLNYNFYPSYNTTVGKSNVNVVAGVEGTRQSQYIRNLGAGNLTGNYQELGEPGIGNVTVFSAGLQSERNLLGFFGRANYTYDDRYRFGISARYDGSSVFTANNRWGSFFGFSLGWTLTEEEFMNFAGAGTTMKLRASYGEVGNQNISGNLQAVNYYGQAVYGSRQLASNGTVPSNMAVGDLTWETTRSLDVGLDFGILNDRINGTIGYYRRFVADMLMQQQLPSSAGISPSADGLPDQGDFRFLSWTDGTVTNRSWNNIGSMINKGIELELTSVNMQKDRFKWTTTFNVSFNQNIINSLTAELDKSGITTPYNVSKTGKKRFVWYVADYAGVDPDDGVPYIYALDQEHFYSTGETIRLRSPSGADSTILATTDNVLNNRFVQGDKSSDPTYYGGVQNKFEYNGFDLNFLVSFSGGNYLLDYDRQVAVYPNATRHLLKDVVDNAWQNPGDNAKYPKLVRDGVMEIDGEFISGFNDEDVYHNRELYRGDFIRLRNITLGYNLGAPALEKLKIQGLRVYFSANNLFTITDYPGFDPEGTLNQNGAHLLRWNTPVPQLKSFILGIDVKI